jgi:hypothetical protein
VIYPDSIKALSPDFMDWPYLQGIVEKLPEHFKPSVTARYRKEYGNKGQYAANVWMGEIGQRVTVRGASLAASDYEVCELAKSCTSTVRGMLADTVGMATTETFTLKLAEFCTSQGVALPACELAGAIARMTDSSWWRRQLRRTVARAVEGEAIGLGLVNSRAGVYASDETVNRHQEQLRRNAKALAETEAENETGQKFTLAELAELGVSNPNIRRAELMTRIKGFEDWAKSVGHVGLFYTWTCPSRMHARLSRTGQENPKYDGTTPKEAASYLGKQWAKARAWMNRRGMFPYGFRVAEPHHDGTPHWHLLLFIAPDVAPAMTKCIGDYAKEEDAHELLSLAASEARFKVVLIDWARGSAAGYIAKYVCKNIDGKKTTGESIGEDFDSGTDATDSAARVKAWASCWGIRQFQQVGGPGVTIWRELRRLKDVSQGELFPHWSAADTGNWHRYTETMGGIEIKRADRPLQVWREALPEKMNRYHEPAAPEVIGVICGGAGVETRIHTWTIRRVWNVSKNSGECRRERKAAPEPSAVSRNTSTQVVGFSHLGRASGPWTRVNNCTQAKTGAFAGLAENMAALYAQGNKSEVLKVFEHLRRLKNVVRS